MKAGLGENLRLDAKNGRAMDGISSSGRDATARMLMAVAFASFGTVVMATHLAPAFAQGNAAAGKTIYEARCAGCHEDGRGQVTLGPSLVGIIGRKAGTQGGGTNSRGLTDSDITWDEASLRSYLASPSEKVHGTIMPIGVKNPQERDDLIAYLESLR